MSFHFGGFPGYAPKQYHPLHQIVSSSLLRQRVQKEYRVSALQVREMSASVQDLSEDFLLACYEENIGNICVYYNSAHVANVCITPCGFAHVTYLNAWFATEFENELCERIHPVTCAVREPTREAWDMLRLRGYSLRTEFVRWYARVGSEDTPFEYLSPSRRRKVQDNLNKSADIRRETQPLTQELFLRWQCVYEDEVAQRSNAFRVFVCDYFARGEKLDGVYITSCYHGDEYLGGCIVNTWGAFGDIGKPPRKYTTFLLSAFTRKGRAYSLGYLLDQEVMRLARSLGDKVYGHGGDFAFWGTEIRCGLLGRKAAIGMQPLPDGAVEAFKVRDPQRVLAQSHEGYVVLQGNAEHEFFRTYFAQRDQGWSGNALSLMKAPWEFPELLDTARELWTFRHVGSERLNAPIPEHATLIEDGMAGV